MNNGIIKFEKLCKITTYSKKKYYIKTKNREILEQMLETKKFVKFGTSTVNISSIDTIEEANPEDNFYQAELQKYTYDAKNIIKKEVKMRKGTQKKELTPNVLNKIIKTYIK